ncbi:PAS domain S-box protein [Myxococcota bacterium]|nr:PAS domain S-box protein [Myxococcota bacterium]MBU1380969.1 PAS domain S-box protein [Myxococcota bacterium]MBU1497089.1 PAS domain S-box protein [Myxococcota bacterium]
MTDKSKDNSDGPISVTVPIEFNPVFKKAEDAVSAYFDDIRFEPSLASIFVSGERYLLVRADSISREFTDLVANLYNERGAVEANNVARDLLFDYAHALGKADAKAFHKKMNLNDPVSKLSAGPIHFAYSGWAYVKILPGCHPVPGDDFLLLYEHPHSFEADSWIESGKQPISPVCVMNAGYSSGWCEESFSTGLVSVELSCRGMGHETCSFVMAPPDRIENYVKDLGLSNKSYMQNAHIPRIPEFFQRKRNEEELKEEKDFISTILETIRNIVIVLDRTGKIVRANKECIEVTGYSESELIGLNVLHTFIPVEEKDKVVKVFKELLLSADTNEFENHWIVKDGSRRLISWSNSIIRRDGQLEYIIASGIDITDKKNLEIQLLNAQKLESIGRLAAGIAHELNTPAQYISDNLSFINDSIKGLAESVRFILNQVETEKRNCVACTISAKVDKIIEDNDLDFILDELPSSIDQAREGIERISIIVKAMKEFSHPGLSEMVLSDVNHIIENAIIISRNEWKYVSEIESILGVELQPCLCHPSKIGQVIINLIVNAAHAISERFQGTSVLKGIIRISTEQSDKHVIIKIEDNGNGIPEDIKNLIFDPFFTTKEVGKGTGQGLSVSRSIIVETHKGDISVFSKQGVGTTFVIKLPFNQ